MKLMQRILSRSLLIILILVAGIAYYYRDQLFPSLEKKTVAVSDSPSVSNMDEDNSDASNPVDTGSEQPEASVETAPSAAETGAAPPPRAGELASVQPPPMQPPSEKETSPAMSQSNEVMSVSAQADANTGESQSATNPAPTQPEQTQPEQAPEQVQSERAQSERAQPEQAQSDSGQGVSLEDARSAYWAGDKARAEQLYRTIMQANAESPEAAGELGNLLYSKGEFEGAAQAYYQAAIRLHRQGADMRARHLARIIRGLDSSKADALEEKLNR